MSWGCPGHACRGPLLFRSGFYFRGNKKVMTSPKTNRWQHIIGQVRSCSEGITVNLVLIQHVQRPKPAVPSRYNDHKKFSNAYSCIHWCVGLYLGMWYDFYWNVLGLRMVISRFFWSFQDIFLSFQDIFVTSRILMRTNISWSRHSNLESGQLFFSDFVSVVMYCRNVICIHTCRVSEKNACQHTIIIVVYDRIRNLRF